MLLYACNREEGLSRGIPLHEHDGAGKSVCAGSHILFLDGPSQCNSDAPPLESFKPSHTFHAEKGDFSLEWAIVRDEIYFKMNADAMGWVGISFSLRNIRTHSGSDMYTGWIDNYGKAHVIDGYSRSKSFPVYDASQDAQVLWGAVVDGRISILWKRAVNTQDPEDLPLTDDTPLTLGWAYHSVTSAVGTGPMASFPIHTQADVHLVNFQSGVVMEELDPSQAYALVGLCFLFLLIPLVRLSFCLRKQLVSKCLGFATVVESGKSTANAELLTFNVSPQTKRSNLEFHLSTFFKRLPLSQVSLKDALFVMGFMLFNVSFIQFFSRKQFTAGQIWGYLAAANSLFVALPATRNSVLVFVLGLSFEKTIMFHRWIGRMIFVEATVHWMCYFAKTFQSEKHLLGFVAYVLVAFIFLTSFDLVRRMNFEWFFYLHYTFVGYYLFACMHSKSMLVYSFGACILYACDLVLRVIRGGLPTKAFEVHVSQSNESVRLSFKKSRLARYKFGQYVFLNFPQVSLLQWHPFTLISSPGEPYCEVLIKKLGDHTSQLIQTAVSCEDLYVRVDGPYGQWNFNPMDADHLILVAGGIGITPCISVLRSIYQFADSSLHDHSRLKSVTLVWTCRNVEECLWFNDLFDHIRTLDCSQYPKFLGESYITGTISDDNPPPFVCLKTNFERLNVASFFHDWEHERFASTKFGSTSWTCVVACGPSELVNETWDETSRRSSQDHLFDFHYETFEF
eukprot:TRINITY_DN27542_c0_g1_i1.p1 TRINITY_DN27542_c0_g1~~TRINITY_DN27542_c0_g1_i1.p1  ORF type:complete len:736 (-),score=147.42 TRINITY_DN27542_c0_g1_i1:3411-5618(-)